MFRGECAGAVRGGRCRCGRQPGRRAGFQEGKCRRGQTPGASLVEAGEGEASRTAGKSIREERKTEIPPGKESDFTDEVGGEKQRGASCTSWRRRWGAGRGGPVLMLFQRGPSGPGSLSSHLLPTKPADPVGGYSEAKQDEATGLFSGLSEAPPQLAYQSPLPLAPPCSRHPQTGSPDPPGAGKVGAGVGSSTPSTGLMKQLLN